MPLYEFQCRKCKEKTESIHTVFDRPEVIRCEFCGKKADRIISLCSDLGTKYYHVPYGFNEPFYGSYGDKQVKMKELGLVEAGDTVGGSRDQTLSSTIDKQKAEHKKKVDKTNKKNIEKAVRKASQEVGIK